MVLFFLISDKSHSSNQIVTKLKQCHSAKINTPLTTMVINIAAKFKH